MTSKEQSCYVYITLPGQTEAVTAARFVLTTQHDAPLGRLVYSKRYMERSDAIELDPVELKLSLKTYETTSMRGVFGSLRDAGADYWGRLLIERYSGQNLPLSEIDYLLESPDDRAGALGFGRNPNPPASTKLYNKTLQLDVIQKAFDAIARGDKVEPPEHMLISAFQTSMGGARPKTVVEHKNSLWLAKFNRPDDLWNFARVEHALLNLAKRCGITVANSTIVSINGREVLLVERFDREKVKEGYLRSRMISALTVLRSDENDRHKWSYISLVEELRRICDQPNKNAAELFRRMCFNALVSNTDDHPRNHAFCAKERKWMLSPAYDLTPSPSHSHERVLAMICGDKGRIANYDNLISQHARFCLDKENALQIIHDIENTIRQTWFATMRESGVIEKDCEMISTAFVCERRSKSAPPRILGNIMPPIQTVEKVGVQSEYICNCQKSCFGGRKESASDCQRARS